MNEELQSVAVDGGNTKNVVSCNTKCSSSYGVGNYLDGVISCL